MKSSAVDRVDPAHAFRLFDGVDIEIDDDRVLAGPAQHAFQRLIGAGVDFLVRHVRWHIDEIARPRFGDIFEPLAIGNCTLNAEVSEETSARKASGTIGLRTARWRNSAAAAISSGVP